MGVVGDRQRLYLGTLTQLVRLENVLGHGKLANEKYDRLYVPRNAQTFGHIDFHELGIRSGGSVVVVNTRYSCLCEPSLVHSFRPIWRPPFISALVPEDRCHLNGLAMADGEPAYVTLVAATDSEKGWRELRDGGGQVIDVRTNAVVCEGLSMPHSPRTHQGKLWLLNSGTGDLGYVEPAKRKGAKGRFVPVAFCPGFLRGLAFVDRYAFVGLSKPRYKRFDGLALADRLRATDSEAWCGVQVIDLDSGTCVDWFRIDGAVGELYDIEIVPGFACPMTVSPGSPDAAALITLGESNGGN